MALPRDPKPAPEKLTVPQKIIQGGCMTAVIVFILSLIIALISATYWFVNFVIGSV